MLKFVFLSWRPSIRLESENQSAELVAQMKKDQEERAKGEQEAREQLRYHYFFILIDQH